MSRDASLYLDDLTEACEKIQAYTEGLTRTSFEADSQTVEAPAWNLVVIGEAVTGQRAPRRMDLYLETNV